MLETDKGMDRWAVGQMDGHSNQPEFIGPFGKARGPKKLLKMRIFTHEI